MASHRSRTVHIVRYDGDGITSHADSVAVEDPIEIRLGDTPLAVTMRTPGDDDQSAWFRRHQGPTHSALPARHGVRQPQF